MQKSVLLAAIQQEIRRHDFSHFVDEPPSIAKGGKGVVVGGCPACKKRINSTAQFAAKRLLAEDVICPKHTPDVSAQAVLISMRPGTQSQAHAAL